MNETTDYERISVLLLDDRVLFRESLAQLLASEPEVEVVADCTTSSEALELLNSKAVEVILLNARSNSWSNGDRGVFLSAAREAGYQGKFLIITSEIDAPAAVLDLRRGASGIFLERGSSRCLLEAIRKVADGEDWVDQSVVQLLANRYAHRQQPSFPALTAREQVVLEGLFDGLTNRKIGMKIGVSEATIKATLQRLFANVGVRTRNQLVRAVLEGMPQMGSKRVHHARISAAER